MVKAVTNWADWTGKGLHSLAVDVSVNFSSPGAPLRAPVFLLALFSTENVPQTLEVIITFLITKQRKFSLLVNWKTTCYLQLSK